jgi:hypothetical protein
MFAPDTPARESGGYPEPGAIMDVNSHPDMSLPEPGYSPDMQHSTKMAGDVLPISSGSMESDMAVAAKQVKNERSMNDIGRRGPSAVDTSNLTTFRRK